MGLLKLFCSSGRWDQNKIKDFDLKCPTNFALSLENEVLLLVHPRTCIMHACTIPQKKIKAAICNRQCFEHNTSNPSDHHSCTETKSSMPGLHFELSYLFDKTSFEHASS